MELQLISEKDNEIYFNGYIINRDLYEILSNKEESDRVETFNNIIEAGAIAIKSVLIKERIDYVKKEFIDFYKDFKVDINNIISDILNEKLGNQEKISEGMKTELIQTIVNKISNLDDNINNNFRRDIIGQMRDIEKSIDEQKTWKKAQYETTTKGAEFEIRLLNLLYNIALPIHDNIIDLRNKPGEIDRCKKGDFLVELRNNPFKFIIEAKSIKEDRDISISEIEEYIEEALKNRKNARFIIMVFEEDIPDKIKGKSFIGTNKLICNLAGLQTAYYNARVYIQDYYIRYKDMEIYKKTLDEKNKDQITEITKTRVREEISVLFTEIKRIYRINEIVEQLRKDINKTANDGASKLNEELTGLYSNIKNRFLAIDKSLELLNNQEKTIQTNEFNDGISNIDIDKQKDIDDNKQKDKDENIDKEVINDINIKEQQKYDMSIDDDMKYVNDHSINTDIKKTKRAILPPNQSKIDSSW